MIMVQLIKSGRAGSGFWPDGANIQERTAIRTTVIAKIVKCLRCYKPAIQNSDAKRWNTWRSRQTVTDGEE